MDALIMSCSTGGGHNAAAYAIKEELESRGHHADVLDPYKLCGENVDTVVGNSYIRIAQRTPGLFGFIYSLGELYRRLPFRSPVYWVNRKAVSYMKDYLDSHHYDVVLTTHLFPGEILTCMKDLQMNVPPLIFVATDYTCIPFTEELDCDYYVIPSYKLVSEFCRRGVEKDRICPLGIPVKHEFKERVSHEKVAESLNLPPECRYILLAGGSIGAGKIKETIKAILQNISAEPTVNLIVICGNNFKLYDWIKRKFGENKQLILLKQTDRMADYVRLSDVFISKPGGLSSTEAAVAGVPLIHFSPIPGCESKNAAFFSENGLSFYARNTRQIINILHGTGNHLSCYKDRIEESGINPYAAAEICDLAEKVS